ncbi:histidine phosphatase family protein [Piscinibacter sakaiensis]|uniref:histidine phosphatase family protein n=1 Tax=Piscinibacter sakaiensis TaxID=1547922 RepID=UPI003AAEB41B
MSLLLIRHGETALNVSRTLQPEDSPLSERGHAQAKALGCRLAASDLAGIVCSDLPRARQTADYLARATGLPIATSVLLRERDFGAWRGRAYADLPIDPLRMVEAPPEGESMQQFLNRAAAAFADLCRRRSRSGGPLAVVTHGLMVLAMLERHAQLADGQVMPASLRNTSVSIVDAEAPHRISLLDDVGHLDEPPLAGPASILSGG